MAREYSNLIGPVQNELVHSVPKNHPVLDIALVVLARPADSHVGVPLAGVDASARPGSVSSISRSTALTIETKVMWKRENRCVEFRGAMFS